MSKPFKIGLLVAASLVAQRYRICLPKQETWVPSLIWEDPTCCRATKPMCHKE